MAIMHFRVSHVSRSTGRSSVQSAAYITGEKLRDARTDEVAFYRRSEDGVYSWAVMAPEHAGSEFKTLEGWNKLEKFEDEWANKYFKKEEALEHHKNSARISMNIIGALPRELTLDQSENLVRQFVQTSFVDKGHYVTYALHNEEGNPHVHMMISHRSINENGEISDKKNRELCSKAAIKIHRESWANVTNQHLELNGIESRISEKSYVDLGIDLIPTIHEGWYAQNLERQGTLSFLSAENQKIRDDNQNKILENPMIVLDLMTKTNATFTMPQLLAKVRDIFPENEKAISYVYQSIQDNLVTLGEDVSTEIRFTSKEYQAVENKAIDSFNAIKDNGWGSKISDLDVMKHIYLINEELVKESGNPEAQLNREQRQAIEGICQPHQVSVLVGRAGAGKTTSMRAIKNIFEEQGCQVVGSALSASAAKNLGDDTGCFSETVRFYIHKWEELDKARAVLGGEQNVLNARGEVITPEHAKKTLLYNERYDLTNKSVFLVDEASMVGMRDWRIILDRVESRNSKLVIVGDGRQFSPVDSGDMHRYMEDNIRGESRFVLSDINRQKIDYMRAASVELSNQNVHKALAMYENKGHLIELNKDEMIQAVAKDYVERYSENQKGVILSYTNDGCYRLNNAIRASLQEQGLLSKDEASVLGLKVALGDKVVFLENQRRNDGVTFTDASGNIVTDQFIRNGTQGTVESIIPQERDIDGVKTPYYQMTINLSNNLKMTVDTDKLKSGDMSHGYALTIHKSQGQTVDWCLVVASKHMDASAVYVAMTRHRYDMKLYYSTSEFESFAKLQGSLSRASYKDMANDYHIGDKNKVYFNNVESYRLITMEMADLLSNEDVYSEGEPKDRLEQLEELRSRYADDILNNYDKHALYVSQAKLTKEKIEIITGKEERPLSNAEKIAKKRMETYIEASKLCRSHLDDFKKANFNYGSPLAKQFELSRAKRDSLALEISQNKPIHKPFMRNIGHGMSVIDDQAKHALYRVDFADKRANLEQYLENYKISSDSIERGSFAHKVTKSHLYEKSEKLPKLTSMLIRDKNIDPFILKQEALEYNRLLLAKSLTHEDDRQHAQLLLNYKQAQREVARLYGTPESFKVKEQRDHYASQLSKLDSTKTESLATMLSINIEKLQNNKKTIDKTLVQVTKEREAYQQKGVSFDSFKNQQMSLKEIEEQLKTNIVPLANDLFKGEKIHSKTGSQIRFGAKGSKCVIISGQKQGVYSDFETGQKGNTFKLIQSRLGLSFKDSVDWAQNWLGNPTREQLWATYKETQKQVVENRFIPIYPAPKEPVDIQNNKFLNYVLKDGTETHRFAYLDADKNLLGYVVRIEKEGDKVTLPLTYCKDITTGKTFWKWKGFGKDAPLYGLDQLAEKPKAPVLVVEGEKAAEAAKKQFPSYAVVSWSGGASAVKQANWGSLKDRNVIMWPDNDKAGFSAASKVVESCEKAGASSISIVRLPEQLPQKWDLADTYPKGFDTEKAKSLLDKTLAVSLEDKQLKNKIDQLKLDDVTDRSKKEAFETVKSIIKTCDSLQIKLPESDKIHLAKQSLFIAVKAADIRQDKLHEPNQLGTYVNAQRTAFIESIGVNKTNDMNVTHQHLNSNKLNQLNADYKQSISQVQSHIQKVQNLPDSLSKAMAESIVQTLNLCPTLQPHMDKLIHNTLTKADDILKAASVLEKDHPTTTKEQIYRAATYSTQTSETVQQAVHKTGETLKSDIRDVNQQIQQQQQFMNGRGLGI